MNLTLDDARPDIAAAVAGALREDVGTGDITAELINADTLCEATIITREDCILCGCAWVEETFLQLGGVEIHWDGTDGKQLSANDRICTLRGNARAILTGERTALNFLQLLSGTATTARRFAELAQDRGLTILDTRKTIPGLRTAQKYAVSIGGCSNHRIGLYDAFLIKENHITACGGIGAAITKAQQLHPEKPIIVEVENYQEYCEASQYSVTRIMLDSLSPTELEKVFDHPSHIALETSGNVDADSIAAIAQTPVEAVSSGALTKHLRAIDLSMRVQLVL